MKAIISGAGIGGLTAALCLHNIGYDVEDDDPSKGRYCYLIYN